MQVTRRYTQVSRKGIETHLDITVEMDGIYVDSLVRIEAIGKYETIDITHVLCETFNIMDELKDEDFAKLRDDEEIPVEND